MVDTAKIRCYVKTIFLALILVGLSFPEQVARRCKGEFSASVQECACTVKNRLDVGWLQSKVLSAYYAPDRKVTVKEIQITRDVLSGKTSCNDKLYFMYSKEDVKYLGYEKYKPELIITYGHSEVRFYSRWFRK